LEILDKYSLNEILEYKFEELLEEMLKAKTNNHNLYNIVLEIFERELLKKTIEKADFNQKKAAEFLGINRNTLKKKLVKYNLLP
jgi:Fis family transcriptional regulator